MDQAANDQIRQEIEDRARTLFPGSVRRIEWLQHGDEPMIEPRNAASRLVLQPDELFPRLVLTEPTGPRKGRFRPGDALKRFRDVDGQPPVRQFGRELSQRLPKVRHLGVFFEDVEGNPHPGGLIIALDTEIDTRHGRLVGELDTGDNVTPVMVRLKAAELDIVDTLIAAGIANNRAEALRWALGRVSERPAYAQLRQHTRDIEALKTEL
jgi:hypothetical protein